MVIKSTLQQAVTAYKASDTTPPVTTDDYDGLWRNTEFATTLTATDDLFVSTQVCSGVRATYYRINDGPTKSVQAEGQPVIITEGANNKLEYWSVDNAGNEELSHEILLGIKLDKTAPTIGIPSDIPESDIQPYQEVKVSVNVTDFVSGAKNVTLHYTIDDGSTWEDRPMNFNLSTGLYEVAIPGQSAETWVKYKILAYDNAGNNATRNGTELYCTYQVIPEFPSTLILPLFMIVTLLAVMAYGRISLSARSKH